MSTTPGSRWNQRRFISLGVLFSALALPVTGLGDHLARHSSGPQAGSEWVVAHVAISSLFVLFTTWHVILNRRAVLKYLRDTAGHGVMPSREALAALAVVGGALVLVLTPAIAR